MRNYRILRKQGVKDFMYGIGEVMYDDGVPHSWTEPDEWYETPQEIIETLRTMLGDAVTYNNNILEVKDNKIYPIS